MRAPGGAWSIQEIDGLNTDVALPELGVTLPFAVLYAGLTFHPRPRSDRGRRPDECVDTPD